MKWIGITGSWRATNKAVESDVRTAVGDIIERGDGIVTGGALNVDYFATDEAMKRDPLGTHIKVCLPVALELYAAHYRKRADEGVITPEQAETLIAQLERLKSANPDSILANPKNDVVDTSTYYERNTHVMELSDELLAFQVNESQGVQDTVDKALSKGKPVNIRKYTIF
ncbi:MAG: hypothetical protein HGA31_02120 [Candidatus Moranbacteria bacterium]|nr:hypothetical protein [Candidatus Moranbacteria bacterium]